MNLWLRALKVIIASLMGRRLAPDQESVVSFLCWPNDIDPYLHMNNGRFLTIMDLGRADLALRSGLAKVFKRHKWWPVVGAVTIRYKRSIPALARFQLHTRMVGWDQRGIYIEQTFRHRGQLMAHAVMKAAFPGKEGVVDPAKVTAAAGLGPVSPPLPAGILSWEEWLRPEP